MLPSHSTFMPACPEWAWAAFSCSCAMSTAMSTAQGLPRDRGRRQFNPQGCQGTKGTPTAKPHRDFARLTSLMAPCRSTVQLGSAMWLVFEWQRLPRCTPPFCTRCRHALAHLASPHTIAARVLGPAPHRAHIQLIPAIALTGAIEQAQPCGPVTCAARLPLPGPSRRASAALGECPGCSR
jgi:hypothetical protein